MLDILFYVFAAITLMSALLMVVSPNAVNGAMCMIVAFVGTAALFVLLEAYFLATTGARICGSGDGPVFVHHYVAECRKR